MADNNFTSIDALENLTDGLENLDRAIQVFATQIVDEMRRDVPKDSKKLMKSIKFNATRFGFQLEMLGYGIPQNYGVEGTKSIFAGITPIESGWADAGKTMKFGTETIGGNLPFGLRRSIAEKGLKPQKFFSIANIQQRLEELVKQQIETE